MQTPLDTLWQTFFDICRFRLKPQDLPYSPRFLQVLLATYTFFNILLAWIMQPLHIALFSAVLQSILLVGLIWGLLRLTNYPARLNQTLIALLGTGTLFSIFNLPVGVWIALSKDGEMAPALPVLLLLFLVGWNFSVYAHIFRHTLSTSFFWGFMVALIFSLLSGSLLNTLL